MAVNKSTTPLFISFASYKGGVGKTSLGLNCAVGLAVTKKKKVGYFDNDEQDSGATLMRMSSANFPITLIEDISNPPEGLDVIILDWPPGESGETFEGQQDLLVVPLQPSLLDYNAIQRGLDALSEDTKRLVVLNMVDLRSKDHQEIAEAVKAEFKDVVTINRRIIFQRATNQATTVYGLPVSQYGVRQARDEIDALNDKILSKLKSKTKK